MVVTPVDAHIQLSRHVAIDTLCPFGTWLVAMMFAAIVVTRLVALGTDAISVGAQFIAMGIMAVGADHTGLVHLALYERTVDINLIAYLAVRPIKRRLEQR